MRDRVPGKDSDQFSDVTDNVTSDGTLVINKVTKKHEGYYMCEATNDVGTPIISVIHLNVQGERFHDDNDNNFRLIPTIV